MSRAPLASQAGGESLPLFDNLSSGRSAHAVPVTHRARSRHDATHRVRLNHAADFAGWRQCARQALASGWTPENILWCVGDSPADLFDTDVFDTDVFDEPSAEHTATLNANITGSGRPRATVPRRFLEMAEQAVCHRDQQRFGLLYRILWRLTHESHSLLERAGDDDIHRLHVLAKAVRRDQHKMRAFLRFRQISAPQGLPEGEHYCAWFEPEHHILRLNAAFFQRRFSNMHWTIVTPDESVHWDTRQLHIGPSLPREQVQCHEPMDALWRAYFANVFNPARLRIKAMTAEMPVKYWKNLPEAPLIADLVHEAGQRSRMMIEAPPRSPPRYAHRATAAPAPVSAAKQAHPPIETPSSLPALAAALGTCTRCPHACHATAVVPGEGNVGSPIMIIGEQPGDREDIRARPFVGPAGQLLRELLAELGAGADEVYFTNAVKHFKYTIRGKRRIHQRPAADDINACSVWLHHEIALVKPAILVALGATAARALTGRTLRVQEARGHWHQWGGQARLRVTLHPAFILRQTAPESRQRARNQLRDDLALALQHVIEQPVIRD